MLIKIEGVARDERLRILGLIDAALEEDGRYTFSGGKYPFDGDESYQSYSVIDDGKVFPDMSVSACMARYDTDRDNTISRIHAGKVSASLSCIEYYPFSAKDADIDRDPIPIKTAMTWNGQYHIKRPNWRREFTQWRDADIGG